MMAVGMFWNTNHPPSIQLEELLSEEDITLQKLMDADDVIQECKSQNKKLVEFLVRPEVLEELVNLITSEPSTEVEERWRYKYSNIACELLTCDVPIIIEKLAGNESLLSKLYTFINVDDPLNALLASFFSKTLHALFRRATDQNWYSHQFVCLQVLDFLKSKSNFVDLMLKHMDTSAIMDLLIILLSKIDDDDLRINILNWLDEQELVQKLVRTLASSIEPEKHENVSQLLCDIIDASRRETEKKADPIMITLQSEQTISLLLETILSEDRVASSSITNGIKVLLNLLGDREIRPTDSNETYGINLLNTVEDDQRNKIALICIPYIDKLVKLLVEPPEKPPVRTTVGLLEKPFGITRLYILKLICSLLSTELPEIRRKCIDSNVFQIMLDLFFQYSWNNFLHSQVQQCLTLGINCDCPDTREMMYQNIFLDSKLLSRIYEAWEENDRNVADKVNGVRNGYLGYLIVIANNIVTQCEENAALLTYLKEKIPPEIYTKWIQFTSIELEEVNKMQQLSLGDPPETYMSSSGVSDEYTFSQDDSSAMATYQENDDNYNNSSFLSKDYSKREALFNSILGEKLFEKVPSSNQWDYNFSQGSGWMNGEQQQNSSSSDEEDKEDKDDDNNTSFSKMDDSDPWGSKFKSISCSEIIGIWNSQTNHPVEQTGWADFESVFTTSEDDLKIEHSSTLESEEIEAEKTIEMENSESSELEQTADIDGFEALEPDQVRMGQFIGSNDIETVEPGTERIERTVEPEILAKLESKPVDFDKTVETDNAKAMEYEEMKIEKTLDTKNIETSEPVEQEVKELDDTENSKIPEFKYLIDEETIKMDAIEMLDPTDVSIENPIEMKNSNVPELQQSNAEKYVEILKPAEVKDNEQIGIEETVKTENIERLDQTSISGEIDVEKDIEVENTDFDNSNNKIIGEINEFLESTMTEAANKIKDFIETSAEVDKNMERIAELLKTNPSNAEKIPNVISEKVNEALKILNKISVNEDFECGPNEVENKTAESKIKPMEISDENNVTTDITYPGLVDHNDSSFETCQTNVENCETCSENTEVNSIFDNNKTACEVCPVGEPVETEQTGDINETCTACPVNIENAKTDPNANDTFKMATGKASELNEICKKSPESITEDLKFSQSIDSLVDKMSNLFVEDSSDKPQ